MVATDQETPQAQSYKGLLDFLLKDEEERAKMRELANRVGAAATTFQQFDVAQPMPMMVGGGLLQQPTHPVMTSAGTGIMGMQPIDNEGEKLAKIRAFLGI
jgi:hypothetical protein